MRKPMSEDIDLDDAITLRMIEAALEVIESNRPSGPDLDTCLDSSRRSEFPAAESLDDESPISR